MKFIISSSLLFKNLQKVSGIISSNNTLPILDNFLFELSDQKITVTTSDNHTRMSVTIEPEMMEGESSLTIPSKTLLDMLKTFADIPLTFIIDELTLAIEVVAGNGTYKLPGFPADLFPKMPEKENVNTLTFPSAVLANGINQTLFATGVDEIRPVISGVFCELNNDSISFVATDAHKLVRYRNYSVHSETPDSFVFPKKPLNQLKNVVSYDDDIPVTLEYNESTIFITVENVSLSTKMIEGKYPKYSAVIPADCPNKLTVDRFSFVNALKRVSIFANQSTNQVRIKITGQELNLFSQDIEFSNEASERLSCNYNGEDMEIGFSSKYLLETLNNISTENILIELSDPSRAGIIFPVYDEDEKDREDNLLMLVMPIIL